MPTPLEQIKQEVVRMRGELDGLMQLIKKLEQEAKQKKG